MSNSYGPNDPRRFIREKTSGIVDVGKDIGKDLLDKVRPEVKDTVVKGAQFAGNVFQDAKTITKEEKYDPSAYVTAGAAYGLEYFGKGVEFLTNQIAQKTGIDPALVALGEMFVPYSKIGKLAKLSKVSKVKNVQKLNNISDLSFLNKVENITGQPYLQTQAAQFINTGDDLTGMFKPNSLSYKKIIQDYKKASRGFNVPKLEKSILKSIKKHKLPATLEDYTKISPKAYNKYIDNELLHWAEKGTGSGKPFPIKHKTNPDLNINYRLDNKSNPSKILDDSGKVIDKSFSITDLLNKKIQNLSQTDRLIILQNTTLDQATVSKVAKLTPGGRIMHHAAPVQSTGKIRDALFKANPKLTQKDWISIQRKVEKELGIAFGDSPLNQRYPKTIAEHNEYHKLLDDAKLYPRQLKFPKGLSPNDAYLKLKELGTTVLEIDKKIGIEPTYTSKSIGKQFGNR